MKKKRIPLKEPGTGQALISWVPKSIVPCLDMEAAQRGLTRSALVKELVLISLPNKMTRPPQITVEALFLDQP